MSYEPRKEIAHLPCLVPWPTDRNKDDIYADVLDSVTVRVEAERFGREVIDVAHMRSLLRALADRLAAHEGDKYGRTCEGCGYVAMHHASCKTVQDA